ncbi:TIGR00730 family Rossman fold protein [Salinicoccus carnicancri]|uniref:LOG family protein n=1 Tax=Salinicoccus carnicancri TaxID=558170 RepID=UPI000311F3FE|nr:TIGR00730 family Rossman fold protein [Salinicoccus carnicancri]
MEIKNITVFCGARTGNDPIYIKSAYELGAYLAKSGIGVVYGGGAVGLMGAVADGALDNGGKVTGVIPQFLVDREMAHEKVQHMEVVQTMHKRKELMEALGDAVISLPGGAGTLEEFFEVFTWGQIGLHEKPIGLLNAGGFYDELLRLFGKLIDEGFLHEKYMGQLFAGQSGSELLLKFKGFTPVEVRTYDDIKRR